MQLCQLFKLATTCELLHNRNLKNEVIQMDRVSCLHNVPKCVLGRSTYLHTDMKAHESYSDPDGDVNYIAVHDNVHSIQFDQLSSTLSVFFLGRLVQRYSLEGWTSDL